MDNKIIKFPVEYSISLKSFSKDILNSYVNNITTVVSGHSVNMKGPINLPTKINKYTVIKSPHVYKKSREQFEQRTFKKLVVLGHTSDFTDLINQVVGELPAGVSLKIVKKYRSNV